MASTSQTFRDSAGTTFPVEFRTTPGGQREVVLIGDGEAAGFVDLGAHLGADGDLPPAIATNAKGVRGWLRAIYDRLSTGLGGTYGYRAGTAAAAIDIPTGARVKRVTVLAGAAAAATLTILGGDTITIPAGGSFDEQLPGDAIATAGLGDVVIGGTAQSYYVAWVT